MIPVAQNIISLGFLQILTSIWIVINNYNKLYLNITFAFDYGLSFATLTATISHVVLFHGKMIVQMWKKTTSALKEKHSEMCTQQI